jgi:peptidyl-prolyl cis-trans isomerase SurA
MNRFLLCAWLLCSTQGLLHAQTLFTYGPYTVKAQEFLWALRKNHVSPKEMDSYLNLFIDYKLKVQAAKDAGLDTTSDLRRDARSFHTELTGQTMKRLEGLGAMSKEALQRGQTDIEIEQIYVTIFNPADTLTAFQKINVALDQLKSGIPFEKVSQAYSTNPYLKMHGGYTGFITVFSLPYNAENIVYQLKDGAYSGIYRSKNGYHIFKRLGSRPNPGVIKASQILFALSPKGGEEEKAALLHKADSIYDLLQHGASFDTLVRKYSDDKMTYYNYGILPEFSTGDYDQHFVDAAFALPGNNAISKPIETSYGYHIIKRMEWQPTLKDSLDQGRWNGFEQRVFYSDRMDFARARYAQSILPVLDFKSANQDSSWIYAIADTLLVNRRGEEYIKAIGEKTLFTLGTKPYTSSDWLRYVLYRRTGDTHAPVLHFSPLYTAFVNLSALEYLQDNLGRYDEDFRFQEKEFSDGSLLFSIMQQQIWGKVSGDSVALYQWYLNHKQKFVVPPSADVLAFNYIDTVQGNRVRFQVARDPATWRTWMSHYSNVNVDSSRYDLSALSLDSSKAHNGAFTPANLQPDGRYHFYYVIRTYPSSPATDFASVRGLVLTDYQAQVEKQWVGSLRKKYPVKVNQATLQQLKQRRDLN